MGRMVSTGAIDSGKDLFRGSIYPQAGQRAYVGLVCMDRNSKDFYVKSLEQNVSDTEAFIESTRYAARTQSCIIGVNLLIMMTCKKVFAC